MKPAPHVSFRALQLRRRDATLSSPRKMAEIHSDTEVVETVADWLGSLKKLIGVPFAYLVPDESMLPPESLRFFQVDPNWQYCLLEGAYSVGRATTDDTVHDTATSAHVHSAAAQAAAGSGGTATSQVTGFLLRSGLVSAWPALKVMCQDRAGRVLSDPPLRFETISRDVLLCMVSGVIATVAFQLPPETLHFGIDRQPDTGELTLTKELRAIVTPPKQPNIAPGDYVPGASAPIALRTNSRVLRVNTTAASMRDALVTSNSTEKFTPAEFAVQMVDAVQVVTFTNASAGKS